MGRFLALLKKFWLVLGAALVWSVIAAPSQAQGQAAVVRFDPPELQVGKGQVEQVNVIVENAHDIYGIDLRAEFDPKEIEIVDTDPDKEGVQMRSGDFIKPDFLVRNEADNAKGTLQYVVTQVNPTPPATGSGIVLTLLVRGKKQGASSPLTIHFVETANGKGIKLPIEPQPGTVQVVAPKPKTATPEVAPTVRATKQSTAAATRAAAAATRPRATVAAPRTTNSNNTDLVTNVVLGAVALGGCLLALLILGVGFVLLTRKPRLVPPYYPPGR